MKTIIRASSLADYSDCPRRWAARTLAKEINDANYQVRTLMPTTIGASVGTAMHAGIAYILSEKIADGSLGNPSEAEQIALTEFKKLTEQDMLWDSETPDNNAAEQQIVRMTMTYRTSLAPLIHPVSVERRLEADLKEGFILSGQSDLQTREEGGGLRDHKSGRIRRTHYPQMGSYSLLVRSNYPTIKINNICSDFIQRVRISKPQPDIVTDIYEKSIAEQSAISAIDKIKNDVIEFRRRLTEGKSPPEHAFLANPSSMLCSIKYCNAWGTKFCSQHKK